MLDLALMRSIACQMMEQDGIRVDNTIQDVGHSRYQRLRTVTFQMNGHDYQAIEQNADKPSRWGQLAREGHKVVQFKDGATGNFVAVAVDGEVREYGRGRA